MAAASIKVAIPAKLSLANIEAAIAGEEALGTVFKSSQVTTDDGEIINEATFDRLFQLPVPSAPTLLLAGAAAPAGKTEQWKGSMVVSNSIKQVVLYR